MPARRLRALVPPALLALAPALVACTPSRTNDAPGGQALIVDAGNGVPPGVVLYVPDPIDTKLGAGVRFEAVDAGDAPPSFLSDTCIRGNAERAVQDNVTSQVGTDANGKPTLGFEKARAMFPGAIGERFERDTAASATRVVGSAAVAVDQYVFSLTGESRDRSGPECGTHYVKSVHGGRFLSYALTVDFPSIASRSDFTSMGGDVYAIVKGIRELSPMLKERGARVALRVYVSKGLAPLVANKLREADCRVDNLDGCVKGHRALMDLVRNLPTIGAPAEKVDDLFARDSTWNAYEVGIAKGEQVP